MLLLGENWREVTGRAGRSRATVARVPRARSYAFTTLVWGNVEALLGSAARSERHVPRGTSLRRRRCVRSLASIPARPRHLAPALASRPHRTLHPVSNARSPRHVPRGTVRLVGALHYRQARASRDESSCGIPSTATRDFLARAYRRRHDASCGAPPARPSNGNRASGTCRRRAATRNGRSPAGCLVTRAPAARRRSNRPTARRTSRARRSRDRRELVVRRPPASLDCSAGKAST